MKKISLFLLIITIGLMSCKNESSTDPPILMPPTVFTTAVTELSATSAKSGGNITSDGGATITARGVCWATTLTPTITNNKTTDGTGTGLFVSNITGLNPGTTYYIRAYATNGAGTNYGSEISFTTNAQLQIGDVYQGWTIFSLEPLLGFKVVNEYKNWEDSKVIAASMGGRLSSVSEQLILYTMKNQFGLTEPTYWTYEEDKDKPNLVVSVIFNSPSRPEINGQLSLSSKLFIFKPLVVHEF